MILQALNDLYTRLENEADAKIAPFGYSPQKIVGAIVIDRDGNLVQFADLKRKGGKKELPRMLQVCGGAKPSGSGLNPCFLWDNPAYLLGYRSGARFLQRQRLRVVQ